MTIQVFSPKWFFHDQLSTEDQQKTRELFSDFVNNDDNFQQPKGWNCNVKSSWHHENNTKELWHSWLKHLKPTMDRFVEVVGTKCDVDIIMDNSWANKYDIGDYQEVHDHSDSMRTNISMVYFYDIDDDDEGFRFYNQEHSTIKLLGIDEVLNTPDEQLTIPKVKTGDVLMFPSHYLHLVTPYKGTNTRITFSANFTIAPVPVEEVSTNRPGKDMDLL
ncbi:2OG-Fe(II) oxygenase [Prochlorococcus phage P-SSM3]|uniref:Uncharacterized protein n=1 Tax=Prochlorococcus phage P-SSM3 TaxID=536453 RepID=R9S879_9CAUD|nr:2OG-Fe(II) oxygenase [Prochlorococcus phage P-SSM3]AGN12108.1 hypothetical protein PRAG_00171 [Prochlorococcus phage P-SSM3]